jgi:hypothetical protein
MRGQSDDFRCRVLRRKHTPFSIFYLPVCYRLEKEPLPALFLW